ncbi:MAG TPA: DPP IV N-terminal domain-containing protein, partial [Puia sp.]|nr:DPP IV N-terminal domain-containing protein [Puia sp.]
MSLTGKIGTCLTLLYFLLGSHFLSIAQFGNKINWTEDGNGYFRIRSGDLVKVSLPEGKETVVIQSQKLVRLDGRPIHIENFQLTEDFRKILIYSDSRKVWRYNTRGNYWVFNLQSNNLVQLGKNLPTSSLMFAKFSPDGSKVAYVSEHNIYVEDLSTGNVAQLTGDGTRKLINGTFDWVYEEEFDCRDGFRWSPDSRKIAYWQIDAKNTRDYLMLNTTDSVYSHLIPVEYPVAGQSPSPFKIGVVDISTTSKTWMNIPTDPEWQSYVPRMEWAANSEELIIQHLNRKQNQSDLMVCNVTTGDAKRIYTEQDSAWIDILPEWDADYKMGGWDWLNHGQEFLWASEKDGWRHLYKISRDGKKENLVTSGMFDVMKISHIDEKGGYVYYMASPDNATQAYLYRSLLNGKGKPERLSPINQIGTHSYIISSSGKFSFHSFSNYYTPGAAEWISLPDHSAVAGHNVYNAIQNSDSTKSNISFFKLKTVDGVEMDG